MAKWLMFARAKHVLFKQNSFNESKCTKAIDQLYECCQSFYKKKGNEARSLCCPIPALLEFKVAQRKKEKLDAKLL